MTKVELDGMDDPPPWMADPEMMPPVFIHYDQLIVESQRKQDELQQQLATSMASIELLKAENEQLREKQIEDVPALLAPSGGRAGEAGISSEVAAEQVRELTEQRGVGSTDGNSFLPSPSPAFFPRPLADLYTGLLQTSSSKRTTYSSSRPAISPRT